MTVLQPSKNKLTGGFSSTHTGYDFDDVPEKPYLASFDGIIKSVINVWDKSWLANTPSDPWYQGAGKPKRALRTDDYGNFLKLFGDNGVTQLAAHFPKDKIIVKVGQRVKRGDILGYAPGTNDDTGNSSGGHTHTEYRNSAGVNIKVDFSTDYPQGGSMAGETMIIEVKDRNRLMKASELGDRLIRGLGFEGNIADKDEAQIDLIIAKYKEMQSQPAPAPTAPVTDPNPDPNKYEMNGLQVVVDNKTYNYKLK